MRFLINILRPMLHTVLPKNRLGDKIYSFINSELTRINVNLITPFDDVSMNEEYFWHKMIKLVDNYKKEEDLLKKMMKIQEKNNDRHTINYNLLK